MIERYALFFAAIAVATPAFAGASAWTEVAPNARMRIISSDSLTAGRTWAALEIDMPEPMKTYWRIPGESGIPTQIDITGSAGIGGKSVAWPYPAREVTAGYMDYVYHGPTVIPFQLEITGDTPALSADVVLGICDEVCVPVQARFRLPLDFSRTDIAEDLRIRQARAEAPLPWNGAQDAIGDIVQDAGTGLLHVQIDPSVIDPDSVILDAGDPEMLFSPPQNGPEGQIVTFQLLGRNDGIDLRGRSLRLTFVTGEGAFETSRAVKPGGN